MVTETFDPFRKDEELFVDDHPGAGAFPINGPGFRLREDSSEDSPLDRAPQPFKGTPRQSESRDLSIHQDEEMVHAVHVTVHNACKWNSSTKAQVVLSVQRYFASHRRKYSFAEYHTDAPDLSRFDWTDDIFSHVMTLDCGGDVTLSACRFQNIEIKDEKAVIIINREGYAHPTTVSVLSVEFDSFMFSNVRYANQSATSIAGIIKAGDSTNQVIVNGCHFRSNIIDATIFGEASSHFIVAQNMSRCSNFGSEAPIRFLSGTKLVSANNYAPDHGNCFGNVLYSQGDRCHPTESDVCGGGIVTCAVDFVVTSPTPPEIPEVDFRSKEPPSRMGLIYMGGICRDPGLRQITNDKCNVLNSIGVDDDSPSYVLAYCFRGEVYFSG
eukprot:scaffold3077_cov162-Amphora_coffeaeformis.AAC.9